MSDNQLDGLRSRLKSYFSLNDFLVTQQEAEQSIRDGISFRGPNILILIFAILIASLGLNTNSTAVIIGAMLISPLMGPIIGMGLALGIQDFMMLKRSFRNLAIAACFSVIASTLYFLISPVSEGHSELLARTSPTIYDVLIGFFGGFAGIIAIASKNKGNVIPGVAIATALMPPLCTAGYGLATMQMHYFLGAFYLFLINSIYIGIATFIGVKLMNYQKVEVTPTANSRRVRKIVYVLAVLTLIPSIFLTWRMLTNERFQQSVSQFVAGEFNFPGTHVLSSGGEIEKGQRIVNVTLIGKVLPQDSLELAMSSKLHYYGLQGATLNIVQGGVSSMSSDDDLSGHTVGQIYEIAQASIVAKQQKIDSLEAVMALRRDADSISARLAPELKVIFPQVADIAVTKAVFGNIKTETLDTVHVALVGYNTRMTPAQQSELKRYLEARLRVRSISLVTVPPDM